MRSAGYNIQTAIKEIIQNNEQVTYDRIKKYLEINQCESYDEEFIKQALEFQWQKNVKTRNKPELWEGVIRIQDYSMLRNKYNISIEELHRVIELVLKYRPSLFIDEKLLEWAILKDHDLEVMSKTREELGLREK